MNNKKGTKRALLTSVMALAMCVVMLVGTTFAWFTDTATANVNRIQSGTLTVELQKQAANGDWTDAEGSTLNFVQMREDGTKAASASVLWEPGCTYELEPVRIVNTGKLALKYKVEITGIEKGRAPVAGKPNLNDVIDWTIAYGTDAKAVKVNGVAVEGEYFLLPGESADFTISGTMDENAGNDYQDKTITGAAITVYATQYTHEYDSTGNQYDADATYPVKDAASMKAALDEINNSTTVNSGVLALTDNFSYANETLEVKNGKSVTIDLAGKNLQISNNNGDGISVENGTLTLGNTGSTGIYTFDCVANSSDGIFVTNTETGKTTTLNIESDVEINIGTRVNTAIHAYAPQGNVVVNMKGATVKVTGDAQTTAMIVDQNSTVNVEDTLFELNADFNRYSDSNDVVGILLWGQNGVQENIAVNIGDNTRIKVGGKNAFAQGIQIGMKNGNSDNLKVTMNGGEISLAPTENGEGYAFTTYKGVYGSFTVNGGSVTGNVTALGLAYIGSVDLSVKGGTFAVDPTDYVDTTAYTVTKNGGVWTVTAK